MSADARKGDLVLIHQIILAPEQRAANIPESTKRVPYEMWLKGFLLEEEGKIGDTVRVETFIGRELSGTLVEVNPTYSHNFGRPPLELIRASLEARKSLEKEGGDADR